MSDLFIDMAGLLGCPLCRTDSLSWSRLYVNGLPTRAAAASSLACTGSRLEADQIWLDQQFWLCSSYLEPNRWGPSWTPIHIIVPLAPGGNVDIVAPATHHRGATENSVPLHRGCS